MSIRITKTYIDTSISGLVKLIPHNLTGSPAIFFTDIIGGDEGYVPLMDARIAEAKALDPDNFQVTFSSAFAGFLYLQVVEVDTPTDHTRLLDLEDRYVKQVGLIESKVSHNQWTALNALKDAQIKTLQTQIDDLKARVSKNEADISLL